MRYTLISVNNPNTAGRHFVDLTRDFLYNGKIFCFGSLYSSRVLSMLYSIANETLTVTTANTVYTFKQYKENNEPSQ